MVFGYMVEATASPASAMVERKSPKRRSAVDFLRRMASRVRRSAVASSMSKMCDGILHGMASPLISRGFANECQDVLGRLLHVVVVGSRLHLGVLLMTKGERHHRNDVVGIDTDLDAVVVG